MNTLYRWSKLIDPDKETYWETQLYIDEVNFAIEKMVNRKRSRLVSFCETRAEADSLKAVYGGGVGKIEPEHWQPALDPEKARLLRIRDRFLVTETVDPDRLEELRKTNRDRDILSFPPQLAFGTGFHPTTANCLRLLVDASLKRPAPWDFLDLGCGSGILSVAAAHLGIRRSVAVDNNHIALGFARQNSERHGVEDQIEFVLEDIVKMLNSPPDEPFDVVAANLFSDLLVQILPMLHHWIKPGGELILSGFLTTQTKAVNKAAQQNGFPLKSFLRRGKWVAAS